jgi:hypothetical protein
VSVNPTLLTLLGDRLGCRVPHQDFHTPSFAIEAMIEALTAKRAGGWWAPWSAATMTKSSAWEMYWTGEVRIRPERRPVVSSRSTG